MSALTYEQLSDTLFTKATLRDRSEDTGKSPQEIEGLKQDKIDEIDICIKNGSFSLKCFYHGSKKCFYLDIPATLAPQVLELLIEKGVDDPFDSMGSEITSTVPAIEVEIEEVVVPKRPIGKFGRTL